MSAIIENIERVAAFTSSKAWRVMTNGKGKGGIGAQAVSYIEEKNLEKKLGRSISTDVTTREMAWGSFLEVYVEQNYLGFGWRLVSEDTTVHPKYNFWAGSADLMHEAGKIGELKCYQPKNFASYTDALMKGDIAFLRDEFPEEYWQGVSNACIHGFNTVVLMSFMPYQSELDIIRGMAENYDGEDQFKYKFIVDSPDSALAYLPDGGYYKNFNQFEFEIPVEDKEALAARMIFCASLLVDPVKKQAATEASADTSNSLIV